MPNKSSKNGSEQFWRTPTAAEAGARIETLYTKEGEPAKVGERAYRKTPSGKMVLQSQTIGQQVRYSTPTSSPSTEPTTPGLTCSQGDFLANLSVSPGSEEARQMTVRSGRKCCELLTGQSPLTSSVRMLLESSRWNSTISFLTWKASATPRGRLLFRLVPSMPDTDATEFGLWHTPTTCDTSPSYERRYPGGKTRPSPIPNLAAEVNEGIPYSVRCRQEQVKMWPPPDTCAGGDGPSQQGRNGPRLQTIVKMMATPSARDAKGMTITPNHPEGFNTNLPNQCGGSLNPQFCEWLMGYPKDWTIADLPKKKKGIQ